MPKKLSSDIFLYVLASLGGRGGTGGNGGAAHTADAWQTDKYTGRNGNGGNGGNGGNSNFAIDVDNYNCYGEQGITLDIDRNAVGGYGGSPGDGEGGYKGTSGVSGSTGQSPAQVSQITKTIDRMKEVRLGLSNIKNKQYYKYGLIDKSTISCKKYENGEYTNLKTFSVRYTFEETGIGTVAVHSGNVTAYYPVKVADVEIVKTEINNATKKNYHYGETIEPPIVDIYYNNGKSTIDACDANNVISGSTASLGYSMVNVKYQNAMASYAINVSPMPINGTASILGTEEPGKTLTASYEIVPNEATYTIQWYRNGIAIPGATSGNYTITDLDIGQSITFAVIGTGNYSGEILSNSVVSTSVSVAGNVTTSNSGVENSDVTTIELMIDGTENVAYTTTVSGSLQYAFKGVSPGTYTMKVSKINHVTREYTVTVSDSDVSQDVKLHLFGDINGDGKVNAIDVARANAHAKGVTALSGYEFDCVDINGDGRVNAIDVALINAHSKGTKSLW